MKKQILKTATKGLKTSMNSKTFKDSKSVTKVSIIAEKPVKTPVMDVL